MPEGFHISLQFIEAPPTRKMAFVFRSYAMLYALCAMLFCNDFWQRFLHFSRTEQWNLENCKVGGKGR